MVHVVAVVVHPADAGTDVTTYVTFCAETAAQRKVTDAFNDVVLAIDGASGGGAGITVVAATGPVPSLFVPVTVTV